MPKSVYDARIALRTVESVGRRGAGAADRQRVRLGRLITSPSEEHRRRMLVLQRLYFEHAAQNPDPDGVLNYGSTLPPRWWMNERLAAGREAWRVGKISGLTCETIDVISS